MIKCNYLLKNVLAITILLILMGCSATLFKNLGSIKPSSTATGNFETFSVNRDYDSFLSGSDVYPVAIFGLHKDYIIDSNPDLWKKIEPKQEVITELVSNIQTKTMECCLQRPHGFDILNDKGKKIGEWYSMLSINTAIRMTGDHKVIIYPPSDTPDLKRYQGRTDERL